MNRTIDARIFFLLPSQKDRNRIEVLIEEEVCESFILMNPVIVKKVLCQQEKSILVLDSTTFPESIDIKPYCLELLESCSGKIIRIFIISKRSDFSFQNQKIVTLTRTEADDDQKIKGIIDELNIWGMRNYIRFGTHKSRIAVFRMKMGHAWRTGVIHDISASGMSCSFDRHSDIDVSGKNTTIEIIINEEIFSLEGNFLIRRTFKNNNMFVLVFSSRRGGVNLKKLNSIIYRLTRQMVLERIEKLDDVSVS